MSKLFNFFSSHPILGVVIFAIALVVIAACIVFFVIMMAKKDKGQKPKREARKDRKAARKDRKAARKAARKAKKNTTTPDTTTPDTTATAAEAPSVLESCREKFENFGKKLEDATVLAAEAKADAAKVDAKADKALTEAGRANSRLDAQEASATEAALQPRIDRAFFALTELFGEMQRTVAAAARLVKRPFPAAPEVANACNAFEEAKQEFAAVAAAEAVAEVEKTHRGCVSTTPDTHATANANVVSPKDIANTRFQKLVRELQKLLKELKAARDSEDLLREDVETFNPEGVKAAAKAQAKELKRLIDEVEAIKQLLPKDSKAADDLMALLRQIKEVPTHFVGDLAAKYEALKASYDLAIAEVEKTLGIKG